MGRVRQSIRVDVRSGRTLDHCSGRLIALVLDRIGNDENGTAIDVLFGALAMRQWGIRPVPDEERLDLSHYTREFLEF